MIKYNDKIVEVNHFPDGTVLLKEDVDALIQKEEPVVITWLFENNEEFMTLYFLTRHIKSKGFDDIQLKMPYIPNARQDRVKNTEDVFTLKYFADLINELSFSKVIVLDPHSYVSEALFQHIEVQSPKNYVNRVLQELQEKGKVNVLLFYPDEGAMKRYSTIFERPYTFGIKKRDWATGEIQGLSVAGQTEFIKDSAILIVDDICSKGGTFYHSAKTLRALGAKEIYLYISHCENTVLEGNLLDGDLLNRIYTTNSIFTKSHEKIEVFDYE